MGTHTLHSDKHEHVFYKFYNLFIVVCRCFENSSIACAPDSSGRVHFYRSHVKFPPTDLDDVSWWRANGQRSKQLQMSAPLLQTRNRTHSRHSHRPYKSSSLSIVLMPLYMAYSHMPTCACYLHPFKLIADENTRQLLFAWEWNVCRRVSILFRCCEKKQHMFHLIDLHGSSCIIEWKIVKISRLK